LIRSFFLVENLKTISPMLFGDGIKAVKLPKVNLVDETHKLKNMSVTQVGDTFMITAGLV